MLCKLIIVEKLTKLSHDIRIHNSAYSWRRRGWCGGHIKGYVLEMFWIRKGLYGWINYIKV